MKLISFEAQGRAGFGVVVGDGVVDLGAALDGRHPDLKALLAADALNEARDAAAGRSPDLPLNGLRHLPVIPDPGKIWCCGLNYGEHVRETNREVTEQPTFFLRVADSQVGHGEAIIRPAESTQLDFEGGIAVIIGQPGRRIGDLRYLAGPGKNFWRTGGFGLDACGCAAVLVRPDRYVAGTAADASELESLLRRYRRV